MPPVVEGDLSDAFKATYDILTENINDLLHGNPSGPDPVDCVNEHGHQQGEIDGRAAIDAQLNGETPHPADPMAEYFNATQICAPDGFGTPDSVHFPSLEVPILTGLEVALHPSSLNSGEDQALAAPGEFHEGYSDGYTQGQIEGFDAHLDQHFAQPEPQPHEISPIDAVIPPLTADPHDYGGHDAESYGFGSSGHSQTFLDDSSSGGGGSSGSGSSGGGSDPGSIGPGTGTGTVNGGDG